jgi:hypothetical protein
MEDSGSKGGRTRRTAAKAPGVTAPRKGAAAKPAAATKSAATPKPAAPKKAPVARKQAAKPPAAAARAAGPDRGELVRMAAFFRAERRGFAPGYEIEDWLAAEVEVAERLGSVPAKPTTG